MEGWEWYHFVSGGVFLIFIVYFVAIAIKQEKKLRDFRQRLNRHLKSRNSRREGGADDKAIMFPANFKGEIMGGLFSFFLHVCASYACLLVGIIYLFDKSSWGWGFVLLGIVCLVVAFMHFRRVVHRIKFGPY